MSSNLDPFIYPLGRNNLDNIRYFPISDQTLYILIFSGSIRTPLRAPTACDGYFWIALSCFLCHTRYVFSYWNEKSCLLRGQDGRMVDCNTGPLELWSSCSYSHREILRSKLQVHGTCYHRTACTEDCGKGLGLRSAVRFAVLIALHD